MSAGDTQSATSALDRVLVDEVMSQPIHACAATLDLPSVARMMAERGIHCVAVIDEGIGGKEGLVGILSDLDLIAAADSRFASKTAGRAATEALASIPTGATLGLAARAMREARAHHLVVVEPSSGRPVGVLSTLDIVRALGKASPGA